MMFLFSNRFVDDFAMLINHKEVKTSLPVKGDKEEIAVALEEILECVAVAALQGFEELVPEFAPLLIARCPSKQGAEDWNA